MPDRKAEPLPVQRRIRAARKHLGFSQSEMAKALGQKIDAYKKYENRPGSLMPLAVFVLFCELTGQDPYVLYAGKRFHSHPIHLTRKTG